MILKLLKTYWFELAIGIALGLLSVMLTVTRSERDKARAERDQARTEVAMLTSSIEEQNQGILALQQAAEQNRELYLAGLKAAEKKAVKLEVRAADVLALPAPAPDEACTAANSVLKEVTQ